MPGRSRNDIIYLLKVINYIFRNGPVRENYVRAVPAGNRAAFFTFDNFRIFGIIYLTRQPGDRLSLSVLANYNNFSKSPIRPRSRAAYLFFMFRIATINKATPNII